MRTAMLFVIYALLLTGTLTCSSEGSSLSLADRRDAWDDDTPAEATTAWLEDRGQEDEANHPASLPTLLESFAALQNDTSEYAFPAVIAAGAGALVRGIITGVAVQKGTEIVNDMISHWSKGGQGRTIKEQIGRMFENYGKQLQGKN